MQVELEIEMFAMLFGEDSTGGLEDVSHDIEILTETATLLLPVRANILCCLNFHTHLLASTLGTNCQEPSASFPAWAAELAGFTGPCRNTQHSSCTAGQPEAISTRVTRF